MPEWLYERGIGEVRAALVDRDHILEMAIEREDDPEPRVGAVLPARLTRRADASGRGLVTFADGSTAQLVPVPPGLTEGAAVRVEIVRTILPEGVERKPARARVTEAAIMAAPSLLERIGRGGSPPRPADLDAVGWSEAMEEAASGTVLADQVRLRIALTPAMTLIDVDGAGSALDVALAGARAAAAAIRRFGIGGSIGIDLPTLTGKADRQAAADALDAVLPAPFERTAVNGFGFLQIVRRRARPSLMERLAADPVGTALADLLRRAERASGHGPLTLTAAPALVARLAARPDWVEALATRIGAVVALREDAGLAISAGHASRAYP